MGTYYLSTLEADLQDLAAVVRGMGRYAQGKTSPPMSFKLLCLQLTDSSPYLLMENFPSILVLMSFGARVMVALPCIINSLREVPKS